MKHADALVSLIAHVQGTVGPQRETDRVVEEGRGSWTIGKASGPQGPRDRRNSPQTVDKGDAVIERVRDENAPVGRKEQISGSVE